MKNVKIFAALFFVIVMFSSMGVSYGQVFGVSNNAQILPVLPMTVKTDKTSYSDGDKITISGTVRDSIIGTAAVTIKIRSPNNNIVMIGQAPLSDNSFSITFTTGGNLWQDSGKYEVDARTGNKDAVTTFQFGGYVPFMLMHVDGTDLSVSYKIVGGHISKIYANVQSKSLVFSMDSYSDGTLTVTLPRALIDSQTGNKDSSFVVMINGKNIKHVEQANMSDRTLTIPFSAGTNEITIIGTRVIPEFGPVAGLVFIIAIMSIILVFSKNKRLGSLR